MLAFSLTLGLLVLIDLLLFFNFQFLFTKTRKSTLFYFGINLFLILLLFLPALYVGEPGLFPEKYRFYFYWLAAYLFVIIPKLLLLIFGFLAVLFVIIKKRNASSVLVKVGVVVASLFATLILYGVFIGKSQTLVRKQSIVIKDLPAQFHGFKIVQVSDIHLGSFTDTTFISESVNTINSLSPDMVVMTGDMINILSDEALPYVPIFQRMGASYGKYAILGNHDMSDYRKFDSVKASLADTYKLVAHERAMGFTVLLDSSLYIVKGNDSISLVGVKNWGLPPFRKHGNLQKALTYTKNSPIRILLSHDPTHWRAEVLSHEDIKLMLAGHTHGMQFGLFTKWFRWSPSIYKYPENMGLYNEGDRYLYVNTGLGLIGFAGRVGILPEITIITLLAK